MPSLSERRKDAFQTIQALIAAGFADDVEISHILGLTVKCVFIVKSAIILFNCGHSEAKLWLDGKLSNASLDHAFCVEFVRQTRS